jgi:hypothetical protein
MRFLNTTEKFKDLLFLVTVSVSQGDVILG